MTSDTEKLREAIDYATSQGYSQDEAEAIVKEKGEDAILAQKQGVDHVLPSATDLDAVAAETEQIESAEENESEDAMAKDDKPKKEKADDEADIGEVGEHGFIGDLGTNHPEGVPQPHLPPKKK